MSHPLYHQDTIAALATPPGRGGVGIIRASGPLCAAIAEAMVGHCPEPRRAHYGPFHGDRTIIDEGIALFFAGPHSFTGEDVLELQGHGGPVIMDLLLERCVQLGARLARPGEFSERAFLNDKLDLAQAEAIADLIEASSRTAAENALRSLQGEFSRRVETLVQRLIELRMYVEAAIDFPEEEIDFLADGRVAEMLGAVQAELAEVRAAAGQGALMREGMSVVIAGRPNAGKSSLLNALTEQETAIVTEIAGTTRDVLREHIHLDGMPLHVIDTAGLRDTPDAVERIGVARAWAEIERADRVLLLVDAATTDATDPMAIWPEFVARLPDPSRLTLVRNKIDASREAATAELSTTPPVIRLSARTGEGVDNLKEHLKTVMGYSTTTEGRFSARRRHLDALDRAQRALESGEAQLSGHGAGELLAEDLRDAQQALGEITGEFSADDLLGEIFGSFCIGK
ncbi:tRNA uridine-5-carboxymethylaminomethyl(34) synthesis GTPase MnmE [Halomonas sp. MCCC 1A17488]|uniref:tRNA uridine-5-carboxymethylaminomethyl(34) synthesis GTPase MnmE n=1 Tax=unclassified Halomonas TaxID=2609666 RepID=UPI0018D23AEE|nr:MULTISPECIES: tRNA uridine-5-carboxymethylaminomethyl(34) synthesis GTPase MnmE [unclassified Halomonas]MCE8017260.1 tRNA uridine-5-carboxymethylaminomethyl(34) synthesis GTPase MnmE [Halomonas sp. MCCC 1A17488]MCG3240593.1 tRNA uridine-5-carboxymethylaminomethyl(34) synthesis GTPase MnmE [Halomonas sp. MCCC 1A17488]QPP49555.1 tRNA uridine-5-carboxymethylaminomethyl(34) synthesis GTPase MnmE [Halomonas sp. SS10-MC5]